MTPDAALAALCGAAAAVGLLLIGVAAYGQAPAAASPFSTRPARTAASGARTAASRRGVRWAGAVVAAGVVWAVSGWPVGGLLAGAAVIGLPYFFGATRQVKARIERLEALEEWTRRLADAIAAGQAPVPALVRSAAHPPAPIAPQVIALANGLATPRLDPGVALRSFAAGIDDALGDMVTLALQIAVGAQASQQVPDVLRTLAESVAEEVKARRAVETSRAGPRKETQLILGMQALIVAVAIAGVQVSQSRFYDSPGGQLVMALLGGLTALALVLVRRYTAAPPPPRILPNTPATPPLDERIVAQEVRR